MPIFFGKGKRMKKIPMSAIERLYELASRFWDDTLECSGLALDHPWLVTRFDIAKEACDSVLRASTLVDAVGAAAQYHRGIDTAITILVLLGFEVDYRG